MQLNIDQMTEVLRMVNELPHKGTGEVFDAAKNMALMFERISNGHSKESKKFIEAVVTKPTKKIDKRRHQNRMVTRKTLRARGLDYPTVSDCAYDLVVTKGMSHKAAAIRMGTEERLMRNHLVNYRTREAKRANRKARIENAERKA